MGSPNISETTPEEISQERFAEYAAQVRAKSRWSPKTKNTIITTAARLFNRYEGSNSAVPTITTKGLKLRRSRPAGQDRDAFTIEDLREIFVNALQYRDAQPCKWWISVAPVFLGCRIEELAQAHLNGDFSRDKATGAMVLRVTEDMAEKGGPAKSVKTLAGWRRVPIHPCLEEAGFVRFLEAQRAAGHATPFASQWSPWIDSKTRATIHSHSAVKWGGRELEKLRTAGKVGSGGKLTYFHSMRHTFVTQLASAGISEEWRTALAGQAHGGVNSQVYNKAREDVSLSLPILVDALEPLAALLRDVAKKE